MGVRATVSAHHYGPGLSSTRAQVAVATAPRGLTTVHPVVPFDNPRCTTPSRCYSTHVSHARVAVSECQKMAAANGLLGAGAVAATTTPVNWPGVLAAGSFAFTGTLVFCYAGWFRT